MVWAKKLEADGATVIHPETLAVGKVKKFWDGAAEKWTSPIDGRPVEAPVIELENGHGLVARSEEAFVVLPPGAEAYYDSLQKGLAGFVSGAAHAAGSHAPPIDLEVAIVLVVSAMRAQINRLSVTP